MLIKHSSCLFSRLVVNRTSVVVASFHKESRHKENYGWSSDKFQFLQESPVPTDVFQQSLPKLSVPKLEQTCERYLASQRPLLSSKEFSNTKNIVDHFLRNVGGELNDRLVRSDAARKDSSFITEPWFDMYLADRSPVSLTHNPGLSLVKVGKDSSHESCDPCLRAANLLMSALRFHKTLQEKKLYPSVHHMVPSETNNAIFWNKVKEMPENIATQLSIKLKVSPIDMSQFGNLLQSTRIPGVEKDVIKRFPDAKHLLVMSNGKLYTFDVLTSDTGEIMDPKYYLTALKRIKEMSGTNATKCRGIGALTSLDRDTWAEARQHLCSSSKNNETALKAVDSALFAICLDDHWSSSDPDSPEAIKEFCCGSRPENRWFDKSISMIFSSNGCAGVNFEHSWGDGVAVMRFLDEIIRDSRTNKFVNGDMDLTSTEVNVVELEFDGDDKLDDYVEKAKKHHVDRLDSVDFKYVHRQGFGKADCKRAGVGPDEVMQLAFQLAHHMIYGKFAVQYESCSTAMFRRGRTETVRAFSSEQKNCAEAFLKQNRSDKECLSLLKQSSKTHMDLTKLAAQGQGWDRHLFALRNLAIQDGYKMPALFEDPAYKSINTIVLSTSTLSSENFRFSFCPVISTGYGLGYQIRESDLGINLSVFKDQCSLDQMSEALQTAFNMIANTVKSQT